MEKFEYREATFNVIRTLSFERTRVKDAANNYLYTHFEGTIEVNFQPALSGYTLPVPGGAPVATPGTMPGETDVALLTRLLQPRGLLRITAGDSVILETPSITGNGRAPCDCKGGPSVDMVGVPLMVGIRHWVCTLHFIADVRDLPQTPDSTGQNAIISNLWVSTEDIDFQRRSTRRFAGRAILRADIMRQAQVNANSFRDLFLFPCPDHYMRTNVHVQISEDGCTCDWSFEDQMRGYDLGVGSPIVDIECYVTGYVTKGSPAKAIVDTLRTSIRNFNIGSPFASLSAIPGQTIGSQIDNLPKYYIQCRTDITGDRCANLGKLTAIAMGVCLNQISIAGINAALTGTTEMIFRQDLADKVFTSVEMTLRLTDDALIFAGFHLSPLTVLQGIVANNDASAAALGQGSLAMIDNFLQDSVTLNKVQQPGVPVTVADRSGLPAFKQNPPLLQGAYGVVPASKVPPNAVLGTVPNAIPTGSIPNGIEKLIVQALMGQGQNPQQPPNLVNQS